MSLAVRDVEKTKIVAVFDKDKLENLQAGSSPGLIVDLDFSLTEPYSKEFENTLIFSTGQVIKVNVVVNDQKPVVIGPPLRGKYWRAFNAASECHRRALVAGVGDKQYLSQRYAIDFVRIDTVFNYQNGHFALYAHLQRGSAKFKPGENVQKGQVLAQLGNSGNSTGPHLHFHVANNNLLLRANGVPYIIEYYESESDSEKKYEQYPYNGEVMKFSDEVSTGTMILQTLVSFLLL